MKDLPNDWYEKSMGPLREEAEKWPEWMLRGVDEARNDAERRMERYVVPPRTSSGDDGT